MADTTVSSSKPKALRLGEFEFTDFASPSNIKSGARQHLVIHKFPGGKRIIQAMGVDPPPIVWSAAFFGPDNHTRRDRLKAMVDGKSYTLEWDNDRIKVVVESVDFDDEYGYCGFTITCVIKDTTPAALPTTTNLQAVQQDVATANAVVLPVTTPKSIASSFTSALSDAASTLNKVGAQAADALNKIEVAKSLAQNLYNQGEAVVNTFGNLGNITSTAQARLAIRSLTGAYETIVPAGNAESYLGRAVKIIEGT